MPETVASVLCKFMERNYSRSGLHHGRNRFCLYLFPLCAAALCCINGILRECTLTMKSAGKKSVLQFVLLTAVPVAAVQDRPCR